MPIEGERNQNRGPGAFESRARRLGRRSGGLAGEKLPERQELSDVASSRDV